MSNYKLVPIPPTPEMVEAAEEAYMPFGDMELAIRMAVLTAPAVQGEPDHPRLRQRFDEIEREICEGKHTAASVFTQMRTAAFYTTPQPAEQQPVCPACPTCYGRGWDMDCQNEFRPATCPDCAGSGKAEHSITVQESDSAAPDVAALVEALESSRHGLHDSIDGEECWCSQCKFVRLRDAALGAYRKQETSHDNQ